VRTHKNNHSAGSDAGLAALTPDSSRRDHDASDADEADCDSEDVDDDDEDELDDEESDNEDEGNFSFFFFSEFPIPSGNNSIESEN